MAMVITIETDTISGQPYAVVVPQGLLGSIREGIYSESILPECTIYALPVSDPRAVAEWLAKLAQSYDNAEMIDVPATIREFLIGTQTLPMEPLTLP